ncbi:MAG: methyltransferase domain-containing protein [Pseudomonadota bacterium]
MCLLYWFKRVVRGALLCGLLLSQQAMAAELERTGGPYVPTPQVVVDEMLRMAKVGAGDFVVDLGSGDGVIVLTAAQRLKARGFGVDIDPELVKLSNSEAQRLGIADRAQFYVQDVFKADISRATVLTLYLLPGMMVNLRPKIFSELRPGTRVVSHDYHFDEWQHDEQFSFDVPEKEKINGVPRATIYLWIVPAKIAGGWRIAVEGGEQYEARLQQSYQKFEGTLNVGGRSAKLLQTALQGESITFAIPVDNARQMFRGRIAGDKMEGTVELGGGKRARWTATRAAKTALR